MPGIPFPDSKEYLFTDFMGERLSIKMFGAKGDGFTDDTNAIREAFESGEHIFIPPGRFMLNELLTKDLRGTTGWCMTGVGKVSELVLANKDCGLVMYGSDDSTVLDNDCLLKTFAIDCIADDGMAGAALLMQRCAIWGVEDVRVSCSNEYRRFRRSTGTLVAVVVSSGIATVETSTPHFLLPGNPIFLQGSATANLNDAYFVLSVGDSTHFTFPIYGAFPVSDGTYTDTNLVLHLARARTGIQLVGAQKGHIYGGSIETFGFGIEFLRGAGGIGSNQINCSKCINISNCYVTPAHYNGADDGVFIGNHTTQGRYSIRISQSGGGITVAHNHFEYMTKIGLFQEGGRVSCIDNYFYNEDGTDSIYVATCASFRGFFNQCNRTVRFGPNFSGSAGVFEAYFCFNSLGGDEIYGGNRTVHFSNQHFSGTPASGEFASMRMLEPHYEFLYNPADGATMPIDAPWLFNSGGVIPGKYLINIKGGGGGQIYDLAYDGTTDTFTAEPGHVFVEDCQVILTTTDTFPTGLSGVFIYFVVELDGLTFQLSYSQGGPAIDFDDDGEGTLRGRIQHGAGVQMNTSAEMFGNTAGNVIMFSLPSLLPGDIVAKRISAVIDTNGLQIPSGGTAVRDSQRGDLIVGVNSFTRENLRALFDVDREGMVLSLREASPLGLEWAHPESLVKGDITVDSISFEDTGDPAFPMIKRNSDTLNFRLSDDTADTGFKASFGYFSGSGILAYLGGTSSSFPALKRASDTVQCRLADDSADAGLRAAFVNLTGTAGILAYLGGTTSSYPAIKRVSDSIEFRLADDSGYCGINASVLALRAGSGILQYFGGTTSSYPAFKRVSDSLQLRLGDDSDFAGFSAKIIALFGSGTLVYLGGVSGSDCSLKVNSGELQFRTGNDGGYCDVRGADSSFANVTCRNFVTGGTQNFVTQNGDGNLVSTSKATMLGDLNVYEKTEVYNKTETYSNDEIDSAVLDLQDQIDALLATVEAQATQIAELITALGDKSNMGHTHGVSTAFEGDPVLEHSHSTDPD